MGVEFFGIIFKYNFVLNPFVQYGPFFFNTHI